MTRHRDPASVRGRLKNLRRERIQQSHRHQPTEENHQMGRKEDRVANEAASRAESDKLNVIEETKQPPLLPLSSRSEDWTIGSPFASGGAAGYGRPEDFPDVIAARLAEANMARGLLGVQAMTAEEQEVILPVATPVASLREQLLAKAALPIGPAPATEAELQKVAAEHQARRQATQQRLTDELAPVFQRSTEAIEAVTVAANEYATVLRSFRATPVKTYLDTLPQSAASTTLVTHLFDAIAGILTDLDSLPERIQAQGRVLEEAVRAIAGEVLTSQEKADLVYERGQLETLCETAGAPLINRVHMVVSMLEQIHRLADEEGRRALFAAAPTQHTVSGIDGYTDKPFTFTVEEETTHEERQALARQLAKRR
jgi:hypothetical protein